MKTVILAGGLGSRLSEETARIPKPLVCVGGKPLITHVMDGYRHWGCSDFVVAAGYKSELLAHALKPCPGVSTIDTGPLTMTGGRLLRLRDHLKSETFMLTYADGLANIDVPALLALHRRHGRVATVTAVRRPARFGKLVLKGAAVQAFSEKPPRSEGRVNGGFFVFEPKIFEYLSGDEEPLEARPLARLAEDGQLSAYKHDGFWACVDTIHDRDYVEALSADPPWMNFEPKKRARDTRAA